MRFSLRHVAIYPPGYDSDLEKAGYAFPKEEWCYDEIFFWCPGCDALHAVVIKKAEGRTEPMWTMTGTGDHLSFSPSILVTYRHPQGYSNENPAPVGYAGPYVNDVCHSFVKDGRIQFLGDCFHALKNRTVDLPDLPEWF